MTRSTSPRRSRGSGNASSRSAAPFEASRNARLIRWHEGRFPGADEPGGGVEKLGVKQDRLPGPERTGFAECGRDVAGIAHVADRLDLGRDPVPLFLLRYRQPMGPRNEHRAVVGRAVVEREQHREAERLLDEESRVTVLVPGEGRVAEKHVGAPQEQLLAHQLLGGPPDLRVRAERGEYRQIGVPVSGVGDTRSRMLFPELGSDPGRLLPRQGLDRPQEAPPFPIMGAIRAPASSRRPAFA